MSTLNGSSFPSWNLLVKKRLHQRILNEGLIFEELSDLNETAQSSIRVLLSHIPQNSDSNSDTSFNDFAEFAEFSSESRGSHVSHVSRGSSPVPHVSQSKNSGYVLQLEANVAQLRRKCVQSNSQYEELRHLYDSSFHDKTKKDEELKEIKEFSDGQRLRIDALEARLGNIHSNLSDQEVEKSTLRKLISEMQAENARLISERASLAEKARQLEEIAYLPGGEDSSFMFDDSLAYRTDDLQRAAFGWNIKEKTPTPPRAVFDSKLSHTANATVGRYILGGDFFVSGGADGLLKFHSARTHNDAHSLSVCRQGITSLCVSQLGKHIAFGSSDRHVYVCPSSARRNDVVSLVHNDPITGCEFLSSSILVTASNARSDCIRLWDLKDTSKCIKYTEESAPRSIAAAPNAGRFISAHYDKSIKLWQLGDTTATVLQHLEDAHDQRITSVIYSNDETLVCSNAWDATVRVRDVRAGLSLTHEFTSSKYSNKDDFTRCCFSPDDRFVLAGDNSGAIFAWDLRNSAAPLYTVITTHAKKNLVTHDGKNAVIDIDWNENGKQIAAVTKAGQVIFFEHPKPAVVSGEGEAPKTRVTGI